MDIGKFIKNGDLDINEISQELRRQIQKKIETLGPEKQQPEINKLVLNFLRTLGSDLSEKGKSSLISDTIKGVIKALASFGIEHINIPVTLVTDMMDFIENDPQSRKKSGRHDKRNAVLEAAMVVFSNKGFHDAHVDEIAELAGVAKGTVYRYFESKEEILKEIIRGNHNRLVEGLNIIFSKDGHILELIKEAISYYIDFFESNKELYKILTHAPWILKEVNEYFYNSVISHLQKIRRRILSLNLQGSLKTTDFYTVFYGIFGFIDGVIQKWFKRNCEYSLREDLPVIIEVLFYGFVGDNLRRDEFKDEGKGAADSIKKII